jgi:hypothetical protein
VYAFYGLTEEEIATVRGGSISRAKRSNRDDEH